MQRKAVIDMTIWEAMTTLLREILLTGQMILILLLGYLAMAIRPLRRNGKIFTLTAAVEVCNLVLFYLLLDCVFHYGDPEKPRTWPAAVDAFGKLPVAVLIAAEVLSAGYLAWAIQRMIRFRRENLTPLAVKETIDLLPAGVAMAEEDGKVVFANLTMNKVSRSLTGRVLTDIKPLLALGTRATIPDSSRVWQFASDTTEENNKTYIRLVATDISAQAEINAELQAKHDKLTEINRRLDIFNRNAERIIISQELLTARMQVHNETGHILLASRHYMEHPEAVNETEFLHTLKLTNAHLLNEYETDDTERDELSEAIGMASEIGVKVKLNGMIPESGTPRSILAAAINECATNIRKHADGDQLSVNTETAGKIITFTLTGNGKAPAGTITETGGLASLRTLTEKEGGTMEIEAKPDFTLTIRVPMS
ncbi:MAG: hypothetical protein IKI15_00705 [Lachnospiraceae bacterium]|nr:hypothetical protein [Lachnospiraceae bacterium]